MTGADAGPRTAAPGFDARRTIGPDAIETMWTAPGGAGIGRIDWPIPRGAFRGSLLFLPGRGDCYEKYLETLDHWHCQGWRVTASDWRGQARSGRLGADAVTGHIDDFATWVDDLSALWTAWTASTDGPHVLVAHSMGGHIALRALAERRVNPDAAVLTAPMLGFLPQIVPTGVLHAAARAMAKLGDPRRPAWKWSEKPGALPVDRSDLLTHDAERYADEQFWRDRRPELVMGPGSWRWVERALASIGGLERPGVLEAVTTPVLIVATRADRLVGYRAIERAARRLPRAQLLAFGAEARHEVLREADPVRDKVLHTIDDFLDRMAPRVD